MMRNEFRERVEQLLQQKEINENSELSHLFRLAIQNLDRNEKYQTVMANLSQGLSLYLMTHHYQAPRSVIDFGLWIAKAPSQERGRLAFLQMLAQTLQGFR
ncbi:TPA: bacteriocin immunity protein [Streptococcus pneumoniae]|nr:bacteriocin immunity protein [Streptococcus pneumoniae]VMR49478.1 bacteriocin immunity protein [Streptococcus pneumoniae]HEU3557621.1 bacteriocin immunity protein [Streptococcus pneumoniae]